MNEFISQTKHPLNEPVICSSLTYENNVSAVANLEEIVTGVGSQHELISLVG